MTTKYACSIPWFLNNFVFQVLVSKIEEGRKKWKEEETKIKRKEINITEKK